MELKRVVVTGLGAVTPLGNNVEETWKNLLNGVSGAAPITLFDASSFKTQFACEVKDLKVNDYIDRKEARKMDRYAQLAIIAAMQAMQDSGLNLDEEDKNRIGVIYGVGIGGIKTFEEEVGYWATHQENGPLASMPSRGTGCTRDARATPGPSPSSCAASSTAVGALCCAV